MSHKHTSICLVLIGCSSIITGLSLQYFGWPEGWGIGVPMMGCMIAAFGLAFVEEDKYRKKWW